MPVTPPQVSQQQREQARQEADRVEARIDEMLTKEGRGSISLRVSSVGRDEIARRYSEAGWSVNTEWDQKEREYVFNFSPAPTGQDVADYYNK